MSIKAVRIESSGNPFSTKITDAETGQEIYATSVSVHTTDARDAYPTATITVDLASLDIIVNAEIKHVCPCCGREEEAQA